MRRFAYAAAMLVAACGIAQAQPAAPAAAPRPPALVVSSTAFEDGGIIPDKYTQKASPTAPSIPLSWVNAPAGTVSFVLMFHDLDVVSNRSMTDSLHWLAWDIPATVTALPEGVPNVATLPDGTVQITHRNTIGYVGPGYPGPNYHHYTVQLIALDTKLNLPTTATREQVLAATTGHVLGKGILAGRFHR
jgi:Raf kinase inhibitor-like YbhB/YbcL family protein